MTVEQSQFGKKMGVYIQSPAKVNLGLRIMGRRLDGYHLLESLFWPVDLYDEIEILETPNEPSKVWVNGGYFIPEEKNIVTRLCREIPDLPSMRITINKHIPIGGGLGGGSSNAGSVLRYFIGKKYLTPERAQELAIKLGADVPFFINPTPSWVTGTGENCTALEIGNDLRENLRFVIVPISKGTSTKKVFARLAQDFKVKNLPPRPIAGTWSRRELSHHLLETANDLEKFALMETPEMGVVLKALSPLKAPYVGMSGSGSTCFAVFWSQEEAEIAVSKMKELGFPKARIQLTASAPSRPEMLGQL